MHFLFWFKILPNSSYNDQSWENLVAVIGTFLFYSRESMIFIYFCYDPVFRHTLKIMPKLLWRRYRHKQEMDLKEIEEMIDQYENTS